LIEIVKQECFKTYALDSKKEQHLNYLLKNLSSSILWLLDGYDEIQIPEQLQTVFEECKLEVFRQLFLNFNLISVSVMNKQHLILTSRPTATINYPYDVRFEITGFTGKNVQNYIENFFGQNHRNHSRSLTLFLKSCSNVMGLCHIPISLEIICTSWTVQQQNQNERTTITTLFKHLVEWLLRRYLSKKTNFQVVNEKGTETIFE
jgi:hypothetical protein